MTNSEAQESERLWVQKTWPWDSEVTHLSRGTEGPLPGDLDVRGPT